MKKRSLFEMLLLLFVVMGFSSSGWPLAVEPPLNQEVSTGGAGNGKVVFGVNYTDVFDRQLDGSGSTGNTASSGNVTSANQVHAKLVYAINQYLNIYGKLGGASWKDKLLLNNGGKLQIDYKTGFSWGLGAEGGRRFSKEWQVFYDLQFLSTPNANVSKITDGGRSTSSISGNIDVNEFQLAFGVGREFHTYYDWAQLIFPYAGISFSIFSVDHNGISWTRSGGGTGAFSGKLNEDQNVGLFAGIRFANESNWVLRLEGHFVDETSFSAMLDYRF